MTNVPTPFQASAAEPPTPTRDVEMLRVRVKQALQAHRLSQREFADRMRISATYLSGILRGWIKPSGQVCERMELELGNLARAAGMAGSQGERRTLSSRLPASTEHQPAAANEHEVRQYRFRDELLSLNEVLFISYAIRQTAALFIDEEEKRELIWRLLPLEQP